MAVATGAGVGRPGVVEAVALDLEGSAGAGQLVAHLLEKSAERGLLDRDQPAAQLVPGVMVAAGTKVNNYFFPVIVKMNSDKYTLQTEKEVTAKIG
jgi:hypothetical protein